MQAFWKTLIPKRFRVQVLSGAVMNSWFLAPWLKGVPCLGFNCYACPAANFACPIGSLQHFAAIKTVPFYLLGSLALVGASVGRLACGWLCPFGWFQELIHRIPVPKWRLPNRFNWTRYLALVVLVGIIPFLTAEPWFSKLCPWGGLEAAIPQLILVPQLRPLIGPLFWIKMAILVVFLAWMAVTRRPFCRWVCPLGAIWGLFNPISVLRLRIDRSRCIRCARCKEVCPVDILGYENPNASACIRCLECSRVCPENALSWAPLGAGDLLPGIEMDGDSLATRV